jgi:hypothetical protein
VCVGVDPPRYLIEDGKGNIYSEALEANVRRVAESYLVCRRKGMPEPSHDALHISFHFRLVEEWKARREEGAVGAGAGAPHGVGTADVVVALSNPHAA